MDRKAIAVSSFADIIGWSMFIVVVLITMWLFNLMANPEKILIDSGDIAGTEDINMLNILRTKITPEQDITDMISKAYLSKMPSELALLSSALSNTLDSAFDDEVCWKLFYIEGEKKKALLHKECKGKEQMLMDKETVIPLEEGNTLRIQLVVQGFLG